MMTTKIIGLIVVAIPLFANLDDLLEPVSDENHHRWSQSLLSADTKLNKQSVFDQKHSLLEDEINQLLTKALEDKFSPMGIFSAMITQAWKTVTVRADDWRFEMLQYPPGGIQSYFNVRFRILSEGQIVGTWAFPVACQLWQNVYKTTQSIPRESSLPLNSLERQSVNILKINQKMIPESFSLSSYETQKPLPAGKFLAWSDLQKKPLIREGKVIDVYAKSGLMSIRAKGRSIEKGNMGDLILVRNISSNKYIQAEIIDENSVKVYF